ncbi:hypothetical protein [Paenibacillus donghaensis]|uniref:Uncharacterized protein n=1 Tax=Paenibacillus donghaensis TaxID=414771 RepID=A0A2Z2KDL0_9BACL|nr:hypothetical protein [Paenibacillus donghaensis]ASA21160.1 hypothetical protein B9T62_10390 [Paenibacillus donghaensis]
MHRYVQGMSEIKASAELEQRIIADVLQGNRKSRRSESQRRRLFRTALTVVGLTLVLFAASLLTIFNHTTEPEQTGTRMLWSERFSVKVFAADGQHPQVEPNVEFPFGDYRVTNSRAPGHALIISAEGAEEIKIQASTGGLLLWNPPDYKVYNQGQELTIKPGEPIYWSPLSGQDGSYGETARLTLTANDDGQAVGSAYIEISMDQMGVYQGRLVEAK